MALLSLRLVSVLICVVLTLVTAVLTLSVSLSFSNQAVSAIGHQYAAALGTNLNSELQSILQESVNQYFGLAASFVQESTVLPTASHWQWWNGSYWTFNNHTELDFLRPYQSALVQIQMAHNFSLELASVICFADGTFVRVTTYDPGLPSQDWLPKGPNPYDGSIAFAALVPGKPGGAPINGSLAGFGYAVTRNYYVVNGSEYTPVPISPEKVTLSAPWTLSPAKCDPTYACHTFDCRQRPFFSTTRTLGPRRCAWYPLFIPSRATIASGISCSIYNMYGQRLGVAASLTTLEMVTTVLQNTRRTANSHAFIVNSADGTLFGSTYAASYSTFWQYGNATWVSSLGALVNNSRNPITVPPGFDGAVTMNATYLLPKKNCLVGTTSTALFIGCSKSVDTYGYAPLKALRDAVGLASANPLRGTVQADGESYFYATEPLVTYADGQVVPGLRWTSVVLTPESDITGDVAKGRSYSIIASVCFFAFAAMCCFALFTVLLSPLQRLEGHMEAAAKLSTAADADESLSAVTEVHNMQVSFYKLRDQLGKLKSFVPQSVLATLQQSEEEGEENDEQEESRVVVVADERSAKPSTRSNSSTKGGVTSKNSEEQTSTRSSGKGPTIAALNLTMGLSKRTVSILIFNIVGLHGFMKERAGEELQRLHTTLLEAFAASVGRGKGVVDSFQGDRFVATFNAVVPNVQHAARAAAAAAEIITAFRLARGVSRPTIGIATGDALVGNAGTQTLRRFCTFGRVYTQATILERLAKQHPTASALLTQASSKAVSHAFYLEALDCVAMEGCTRPVIVYALRAPKAHAVEEWNYAMAATESQDEFLTANEAWNRFAEGDSLAAKALLLGIPESSAPHPGADRLRELLNRGEPVDRYTASSQGQFYDVSYVAVGDRRGTLSVPNGTQGM